MVKLTGVVLRRNRFGDSSDVIHMITGEMGLVRFNALGIRRPKSRSKGALETLSLSSVVLYDSSRDLWKLKEARLIRSFPGLFRAHKKFQLAGRFAKILDRWAQTGPDSGGLLVLTVDFLSNLEKTGKPENAYLLALLKLAKEAGVSLGLDRCPVCGQSSSALFCDEVGFVCENSHPGLKTVKVPENTRQNLIRLWAYGWAGLDKTEVDEGATRLIERFIQKHTGGL